MFLPIWKRNKGKKTSANNLAKFKDKIKKELVGIQEEIETLKIDMKQEIKKLK